MLLGTLVLGPSCKDEKQVVSLAACPRLTRRKSVVKIFDKDSIYAGISSPWPPSLLDVDRRWQKLSR